MYKQAKNGIALFEAGYVELPPITLSSVEMVVSSDHRMGISSYRNV